MLRYFKMPLIVTGIVLAVVILVGVVGITIILQTSSGTAAEERAAMLGGGTAIVAAIVIAPFWIFAAAKFGKDRREALARPAKKKLRK